MLLQNRLKRVSSSLYHKHIPIRNKKRPAAARRFCISLFIQIKAAGKVTVRLHGEQVVLVLVHLYIVYTKVVCRCVIMEPADLLAVRSPAVAGGDHPICAK